MKGNILWHYCEDVIEVWQICKIICTHTSQLSLSQYLLSAIPGFNEMQSSTTNYINTRWCNFSAVIFLLQNVCLMCSKISWHLEEFAQILVPPLISLTATMPVVFNCSDTTICWATSTNSTISTTWLLGFSEALTIWNTSHHICSALWM